MPEQAAGLTYLLLTNRRKLAFKPSVKTIILITLTTLVSECGPAATPIPSTAEPPPTITPLPSLTISATSAPVPATAPLAMTDAKASKSISPDNAAGVELLRTIEGHQGRVWNVAFSGDGAYIASTDRDSITVWDAVSGQEAFALSIRELDLNSFVFSPDNRLLASAQTIWDVESQQPLHTLDARLLSRGFLSQRRMACRERCAADQALGHRKRTGGADL